MKVLINTVVICNSKLWQHVTLLVFHQVMSILAFIYTYRLRG